MRFSVGALIRRLGQASILSNWYFGASNGNISLERFVAMHRNAILKNEFGSRKKSVIIADDHHLIVHSLKLLVEDTLGLDCIGVVHDGLSCIDYASVHKPDLIILDLDLPTLSGGEVVRFLRKVSSDSRILVITAISASRVLKEVLESGANGMVLKGATVNVVCEAISNVLLGKHYVCAEASAIVVKQSVSDSKLGSLTRRERQVFELLLQRTSCDSISKSLSVSPKTVDNHKSRIMAKLDVHTQADLMAFAVGAGFQDLILKSSPY